MYPNSFKLLLEELKKMPGIGPKSAQRLAFYLLSIPKEEVEKLLKSIIAFKKNMQNCKTCYSISDQDPCEVCGDNNRDRKTICIVEEPKDLMAIERSRSYNGLYHVLGGRISPLDGLGPESLRIKELLERINNGAIEVILALNPTTESEATAIYLTRLIKPLGIKVTRLAMGLPMGGDLDYTDEVTLSKSLEGRREL